MLALDLLEEFRPALIDRFSTSLLKLGVLALDDFATTPEPIPALGNLTPRQAVRTRAGRLRVIELLKEHERNEKRNARERGLEPASLAFLWEELGIAPPQ